MPYNLLFILRRTFGGTGELRQLADFPSSHTRLRQLADFPSLILR